MTDVTTIQAVELGVLGPLQARRDGAPVMIPGAKPRAILTMLGLHGGAVVSADALIDLLWGDQPPRTAAKALQTHISALRRVLGDGFVLTEGTGWILSTTEVDAPRYKLATKAGRDAAAAGDTSQAVARFEEALTLWRGTPELPDSRRGVSEKTRWIEGHAALVEDRADALLATGRAAEIIGELEAAVADAPLRERRWAQLMLALYRAGRQGEALRAYQRARSLLADELGVDPGPDLRRLAAAIIAQDAALDHPMTQHLASVTRAVTFLLTDIEGSTAAWEADAGAMAVALARHDELVEQIVTSRGGRLIKTRGEGDATFSVFDRPSAAAAAALELQDAIRHEPWGLHEPMRIRIALHTGEVELRDGDYFGRAVNRAARLRSLALGGQILCSGATAELVIDTLPEDVVLADLGMRALRNLPRPEHVFELRLQTAEHIDEAGDEPLDRPDLPAVLTGPGRFVGRGRELERLASAWQTALIGGLHAVLIAGEPGVGKTRLAGEWSQQAYGQGAVVLYGRSDEDLGAPYQPFAEALRSLVPCIGAKRLRSLRGVEALLPLVPGLTEVLPDLCAPPRADPDTERYALFDAVVALLELASTSAPVVLILDDLHWAAKPTLLLLRHLLRFGDRSRVQVVATYRSTDLDRSHPLAAMLADLHRDGTANRLTLGGLDEDDVSVYVSEAGYDDEDLARALASVTGGNPFFLIEALRHVDESGGVWDPNTLPQGVREAVSRRLSRLPAETNKALAAAAVVGSRFAVDFVERVIEQDLVDAFDEACRAGIVIEESGGRYRFNHAIVRQALLAELASVRRMRLHQRIATTLEATPGADDELLAELAHHYFECAWAGNAAKAVEYCRRAADQSMSRLAYEGAADLYDRALHALEEIDDELPDRTDQAASLLVARCEALLAAGDVASAVRAVEQLQAATVDSVRLAAWATCFDGQLSMLIHPERLDEVEAALGDAADELAGLGDAAGEAKAQTVRAGCLTRLGRIGDCEIALDDALTAARRAHEHRRVNAVLAGAPLAALWGPNPVPRAGGRCLDVVRLLRITTDSPAVEATSTRCQAVLEAFRGRAATARRMIESARRTVTEIGLRHALLEVEQFAGIIELVLDDPAAAEPHLRQACHGFRRMGLDADTAETAALLGRTCLALDRDTEAAELCTESERLAGHALKASIAWRTLRALLLARKGDHDEARRMAEAAVGLAERTDALVDHGDACLALATVLNAAGDKEGARAAAERAVDLYERKEAAALADKARSIAGKPVAPHAAAPPASPTDTFDTACVRTIRLLDATYDAEAWDDIERQVAAIVNCESRRKIVGAGPEDRPSNEWVLEARHYRQMLAPVRYCHEILAVRGEHLALTHLEVGTADISPGAPRDEFLQLYGIDAEGRLCLLVWFDLGDMEAALAELDAVYAQFETPQPRPPLQNAATRLIERFLTCLSARDWPAIAKMHAEDSSTQDRRRVVSADAVEGREANVANWRALSDLGIVDSLTSTTIAIRGERLTLARAHYPAFQTEGLVVVEIDTDERFAAVVAFDPDDFGAAITELDARYLAGEAAACARVWSIIADSYAALNRHELPVTTPDCANIDHRREAAFGPGDVTAYVQAGWDDTQDIHIYVEHVHRLDSCGAVVSYAAHETSRDGVDAEWRGIALFIVEDGMIDRTEVFDETDLAAAIARFEAMDPPQLENTATRAIERSLGFLAARDWPAMAQLYTDDISADDRRRVVAAEVLRGREANIASWRALADLGLNFDDLTSATIATRGERLALTRVHTPATETDVLNLAAADADGRVAAVVVFDPDDLDAALAELDARYLAGEAAAHARTWSVISGSFAALNRREMPATTPDWVNVDHRRGTSIAPGEMPAVLATVRNLASDLSSFVVAVHRLTKLGLVITHATRETSPDGFLAEWHVISVLTCRGDLIERCEVFDASDLDAALARFEELDRQPRQLKNAASQVMVHYMAQFAAQNWDAIAEMLANDVSIDDRRQVVNSGVRHGPDAYTASMRAIVDTGTNNAASTVVAIRGEHLAISRTRFSGLDQEPQAFVIDLLAVVEIDAEEKIVAVVVFDIGDLDSAIEEMDARYLTGEAAADSSTWSFIATTYAGLNRGELPATTRDWTNADHRRTTAFAAGQANAYFHASWELAAELNVYIEAVHRLNERGAVFTHVGSGTSRDGFEADWRAVDLIMVEGGLISRAELFDEADLDAALTRFEELSRSRPALENAATRNGMRIAEAFNDRDGDAIFALASEHGRYDDRRKGLRSVLDGPERRKVIDATLETVPSTWRMEVEPIAVRGSRLSLTRDCYRDVGDAERPIAVELLHVMEVDTAGLMEHTVTFDLDDIDAALAELEARYVAGEAADHAHTWSLVTGSYAALNRHEIAATTPDWVSIDHRRGAAFEPGDMIPYLEAAWGDSPDTRIHIAAVHRLTDIGAVITHVAQGISQEGFDAEWRDVTLLTVDGDLINRSELFDGDDLDAALARFDELS